MEKFFDLFTWTRALLTGRVISIESLDEMFTVQAGNYGYGWFLGDAIGGFPEAGGARGKVVHHDGGCPGFDTRVVDVLAVASEDAGESLVDHPDFTMPKPDPRLSGKLADLLGAERSKYGVALLDITDLIR